ncbi:Arrestin domain-containing protein 4 [Fukomys damarensis]|uniref:Arrestin domain-containing protein 4 n=1 Tax=Fukomys damarensis TaxID=885580 RepID=A0A091CQN5_FUKDA|nr:Arrestin domain-containing protein 4 [Fukomys damarensis]
MESNFRPRRRLAIEPGPARLSRVSQLIAGEAPLGDFSSTPQKLGTPSSLPAVGPNLEKRRRVRDKQKLQHRQPVQRGYSWLTPTLPGQPEAPPNYAVVESEEELCGLIIPYPRPSDGHDHWTFELAMAGSSPQLRLQNGSLRDNP